MRIFLIAAFIIVSCESPVRESVDNQVRSGFGQAEHPSYPKLRFKVDGDSVILTNLEDQDLLCGEDFSFVRFLEEGTDLEIGVGHGLLKHEQKYIVVRPGEGRKYKLLLNIPESNGKLLFKLHYFNRESGLLCSYTGELDN